MKPYERLRESPSPALNSTVLEFPDGNYLNIQNGGCFVEKIVVGAGFDMMPVVQVFFPVMVISNLAFLDRVLLRTPVIQTCNKSVTFIPSQSFF
jgi:hypothetical protein